MVDATSLKQGGIVLAGAVGAAALAVGLFGLVPQYTGANSLQVTLGLLLFVAVTAAIARKADDLVAGYDVAEVEVDDVITRDGEGGPSPMMRGGVDADEVVDQIERADADSAAQGLIVKLNTPGGMVVPSEDIRKATADFDGPTVAYAEDMATSGGYWIASGADEFHARKGAMVGSIGVNGTQLGRKELADKVGLDYRRFVAGDYKDTISSQWREMREDEIEYFQGLLDDWYDQFVETVVAGRDLDEQFVRDTEARIYNGEVAHEKGLVDHCGPREELEDRLADRIGVDEITVEEFEPDRGLSEKVSMAADQAARAAGSGVAAVLVGDDEPDVRV